MDHITLNSLDYVVLAVMSISLLFGLLRGFVGSVLSFTGWIASIYVSYVFLPHTKELYTHAISNPAIATAAGYITSLLVSLIGFGLLNIIISKSIGAFLTGGIFDRLLGIAFGAMRGAAIISALYLGFVISWNMMDGKDSLLSEDKKSYPDLVQNAYTYDYMVIGKDVLIDLLPANVDSSLAELSKKFGAVKSVIPDVGTDNNATDTSNNDASASKDKSSDAIVEGIVSDLVKNKVEDLLSENHGNEASDDHR